MSSLVEISQVVLEGFVKIFLGFRYYLPMEKGQALHLNKLESTSPKFGWNWLSGSGEEDFKILLTNFFYFVIISP